LLGRAGMRDKKPDSRKEPVDPKVKDPQTRPKQDKGPDPNRSSRTPDTEPPKDKRSDDL
jgi:hypothetical protein